MSGNRYWEELTRHGAAWLRLRLAETREMLVFLTIARIPNIAGESPAFTTALRTMPLAGAVIGIGTAAVLLLTALLNLPPLLAAAVTIATLVAATGALHEDALADVADGFGGGATASARLEIMRDSRIGTFGTVALVLSLLIRVAALASLAGGSFATAATAVFAAAVLSRTGCVAVLAQLPPARPDGLGASAGTPDRDILNEALVLGGGLAGIVLVPGAGLFAALTAIAAGAAATWAMIALARARIGGQTGDVAGAGQQAAECAVLVAIAASAGL
jgi:adenosylcobinamide-GDP ribazoletransferase